MTPDTALTVSMSHDNQLLHIHRTSGTHILSHRICANQRPFIHPIYAPDGDGVLTEDAPSHHPWQHGLYTGFNVVNGIGFWKELPEDGTFHPTFIDSELIDRQTARWSLTNLWRAPNGMDLIIERQDWALIDEGLSFDIDLVWTLEAAVDVEIGQYMAGGLFLRMPYTPEKGGLAINSEGKSGEHAEKQRARWMAVSMPISGREDSAGFAIFDHPTNPSHPVTWRVDNELGISPSRCIDESWTIAAGRSEQYRFRLHSFCGPVQAAEINECWRRFAND